MLPWLKRRVWTENLQAASPETDGVPTVQPCLFPLDDWESLQPPADWLLGCWW